MGTQQSIARRIFVNKRTAEEQSLSIHLGQLWLVSVQLSIGTDGGVTKSLDFIPSHCGLNNTCKLYCPAGRLIMTTVTPGLSWSVIPVGSAGSLSNRFARPVVMETPLGAFRIDIVSVLSPIFKVAVVPSTVTVALVCILHMIVPDALMSSCRSTCLRPLRRRTPRLNDVLSVGGQPSVPSVKLLIANLHAVIRGREIGGEKCGVVLLKVEDGARALGGA